MKKIIDVSLTVDAGLPTWPGDPPLKLEMVKRIAEGANSNVSRLDMGVHTGTHVDAPLHFVEGAGSVEFLDLDILMGPVQVVELPETCMVVMPEDLEAALISEGTARLLLKTRNSAFWAEKDSQFHTDFTGVSVEASRWLVEKGIRLIGLDYLSISPYKKSRPTHEVLLEAGMVVIEGLDLRMVSGGFYQLVCLPLKLGQTEGAPARVVLIQE